MTDWLANPSALWAALLFAPLILLYLLRHRPVRRRVPSVALWAGIADAQVSTSPFQRLRRSVSLLLMCLALLALLLALAGLRIPQGRERGLPLTIVVDVTASMAAAHGTGTRMDAGIELANRAIAAAGDTRVTVLVWDGALKPLGPAETTPASARTAIAALTPVPRGADPAALAAALDQLQQDGRALVLVSDSTAGQRGAILLQAGEARWNAGIVSAGVGESLEVFFGVESFGEGAPGAVGIALERVGNDGAELLDARDVALAADRRASVRFRVPGPGLYRGVLRADDGLITDNEAWVRVVSPPPLAVSMDDAVPQSVRRALAAIEQGIGSIRVQPSGADSTVFADAAAAGAQPRLPSAYIGPHAHPPRAGFGDVLSPSATTANVLPAFLWRGAEAPEIAASRVWPIALEATTRPVLEVDGHSVIALNDRGNGLRDLMIGVSLEEGEGTFINQAAFVLFWANWFDYVRSLLDPLPEGAISTRDALRVAPLDGLEAFRIRAPGGEQRGVDPGVAYTPAQAGVYHVDGLETEVPMFGASLLDTRESNLAAATMDNEAALAELRDGAEMGERAALELAPWLALLAAGLLITEWMLFRRRFPRAPAEAEPHPSTHRRTR